MKRYEIRVVGHIDVRRARALGAEACRLTPDGLSVLEVAPVDRAATYGLLARLRDAGIELVSVVLLASDAPGIEERGGSEVRTPPDATARMAEGRFQHPDGDAGPGHESG